MNYLEEFPYLFEDADDSLLRFYDGLEDLCDTTDQWYVLATLASAYALGDVSPSNPSLIALADFFLEGPCEIDYEADVLICITRAWENEDAATQNRNFSVFIDLLVRLPPKFKEWTQGWLTEAVVAVVRLFPQESAELGIDDTARQWSYDVSNMFDDIIEEFDDKEFAAFTGFTKPEISLLSSAFISGGEHDTFVPSRVPADLLERLPDDFSEMVDGYGTNLREKIVVRALMLSQEPFRKPVDSTLLQVKLVVESTGEETELSMTEQEIQKFLFLHRNGR